MAGMSLDLHRLVPTTTGLNESLPKVLALSNAIFLPDTESKYTSMSFWRDRLSLSNSQILYLATDKSQERSDPVAFVFAHPRTHTTPLRGGEIESMHIWLAGVLPEWRRAGCLARMIHALESELASSETQGGRLLTVCTVPSRFPDMWSWLLNRGWEVERKLGEGNLKVMLSKCMTRRGLRSR